MMYSNIPSAQTLVLYFQSWGVKHIVISPGSRNAPLTLSFSKNSFFTCYSIVDERSAAFFALGMAQQRQEPVAVVCTSGSAILNYYPAVAEAFYSDIPLIVVSADRPSYRIDIGDGQTIRQENVLERHIGYSANLKQDVSHAYDSVATWGAGLLKETQKEIQEHNEKQLATALHIAKTNHTPVHINIPFEEPLYQTVNEPTVQMLKGRDAIKSPQVSGDWTNHASKWASHKRKMILVGVNQPNSIDQSVLKALSNDGNTVVFTETTSNVHHPEFFSSIDSIIAPIEKSEEKDALFKALQPDLLVTFGGLIVSKKIKAFLRKYQPKEHWHIDPKKAFDTFYCLTDHVKSHPNDFFNAVVPSKTQKSDYKTIWLEVKSRYETRRASYLKEIPFTDFSAFARVLHHMPKGYQVHLANSSTVRYAQLFPMDASLKVFCNRGTSGIDGSTSTAIGASIHATEPTLLITGDLSFFYDSNGLWNNYIRPDFRIILINNAGGGIFRILPGKEDTEEFATFFETEHNLSSDHLAAMFGFEHRTAENEMELGQALQHFYDASTNPKILEIKTPRLLNNKILLGYFDFIS